MAMPAPSPQLKDALSRQPLRGHFAAWVEEVRLAEMERLALLQDPAAVRLVQGRVSVLKEIHALVADK